MVATPLGFEKVNVQLPVSVAVKTVPKDRSTVAAVLVLPIIVTLSENVPRINFDVTTSPVPSGVRVKLPSVSVVLIVLPFILMLSMSASVMALFVPSVAPSISRR